MSKKSMVLGVFVVVAAFVAGTTLVSEQAAWGDPRGGEKNIQPGGWPAKLRSFYAQGSGSVNLTPSIPGTNGFIVTQIRVSGFGGDVKLIVDGSVVACMRSSNTNSGKIDLNPGIPTDAGLALAVEADGNPRHFVVLGYEY